MYETLQLIKHFNFNIYTMVKLLLKWLDYLKEMPTQYVPHRIKNNIFLIHSNFNKDNKFQ